MSNFILDNDKSSNDVSRKFRDELNFAEFPLASLSNQIDPNQKSLTFTDEVWDKSQNKSVKRTLTISASSDFGLPSPLDDEVILGLIQASAKSDFNDRTVKFSRTQILQILGWRLESKSYARIDESLKKWLGVTLHYEKAWWDKDKQSWVDESFHILDRLTLYDRERQLENIKSGEEILSSFTWNEVVFNSFKSGNLKRIDFDLFKSLKSSIAKRIYRFLDKRFYQKAYWEFDLETFAFEHIGLSKNYHTGELKRILKEPIKELEKFGFLKVIDDDDKYIKVARGLWKIAFVKGGSNSSTKEENESQRDESFDAPKIFKTSGTKNNLSQLQNDLIAKLRAVGVSEGVARILVKDFDAIKIQEKIDYVTRLVKVADPKASKNVPGFLVKAIKEDYPVEVKKEFTKKVAKVNESVIKKNEEKELAEKLESVKEEQILNEKYYSKSESERDEILEKAYSNCMNRFLVRQAKGEGTLADSARRKILLEWVR